ncbi:MAG: inositol monophosphatase family protein [Pseudanabaenaceae cyanobacterium]
MNLLKYLDIATIAALKAGAVLKQYYGKLADIQEKQPGDLVTIADQEAEAIIIDTLCTHCPDHQILAEESGAQGAPTSPYLWAIDPLDGTTNFAHQFPFYAVSIALLIDHIPSVGVIYAPFFDELYQGAIGLGATCNHQPIHVSTTTQLSKSLLVTGFAYDRRQNPDNNYAEFCHFTHISQGVRRPGAAAIDLAFIASGRLDGYWERGLCVWDIAAGVVLVQEAGGKVTAYDGSPLDIYSGRLLATNSHIHQAMVRELSKIKPLPINFPLS